MTDNTNNPETIYYHDQPVRLEEVLKEFEAQQGVISELKNERKKAVKRYRREEELKPYQAELIKSFPAFRRNKVDQMGMVTLTPYHPGAIKAYKDLGMKVVE